MSALTGKVRLEHAKSGYYWRPKREVNERDRCCQKQWT